MSEAHWPPARRTQQRAAMEANNLDPQFVANKVAGHRDWHEHTPVPAYAVPEHAHPLVRGFYAAVNAERCRLHEIAGRTNIHVCTLRQWRTRYMPRVDLLDAALNALDLELAIVPRGSRDADGIVKRRRSS